MLTAVTPLSSFLRMAALHARVAEREVQLAREVDNPGGCTASRRWLPLRSRGARLPMPGGHGCPVPGR